jgi:pyruvate dehydrogenase E2 component (dihydrolipoamide acetyltransferase)
MATEVLMPRQGQSVESCIIIEWRVQEGDTVEEGQPVCDIETDKAAFEVEAPATGTVLGIFYPVDADIEVLKTIAVIGEPGEDISSLRPADQEPSAAEGQASGAQPVEDVPTAPVADPRVAQPGTQASASGASPRAKKRAAEKGVDIAGLAGSGPHGRVIERDVIAAQPASISPAAQARTAAEGLGAPRTGSGIGGRVLASDLVETGSAAAPVFSTDFPGNTKEVPVRGVRKLVAERMHASLQNTAQLTHHASADARAMLAYRKRCKAAPEEQGLGGITINDFVMYATIRTLAEFPELNAHWLGERIVQFEDVHLGMAVDTERGLVVPVIRNANHMSLGQLSTAAGKLAQDCINGNIDPDALQGGTFTVTNLGALGIEAFTPVLNAPEVGILGVCAIQPKPVITGTEAAFVPHLGLSLTFDHCAVDGAPAARFLARLRDKLAAFESLLEQP